MRSWWSTSGLTCSPTLSGSRPPAGQITVVLRRGEGEVTVSVSDTGIGMDEETQRHIFDRFYRLRHTRMTGATAWASPLSAGW